MKSKLLAPALGLLVFTIVIGTLSGAATASAEPETDTAQLDTAFATGDHDRLPAWLRHSIIVCAAETIDAPVSAVKAGLRAGFSLKQIAARHGVRPLELKRGILHCEAHFLHRAVLDGKLTRAEAARVYAFLEQHIERIINYHYESADEPITDRATDRTVDVAPVTD